MCPCYVCAPVSMCPCLCFSFCPLSLVRTINCTSKGIHISISPSIYVPLSLCAPMSICVLAPAPPWRRSPCQDFRRLVSFAKLCRDWGCPSFLQHKSLLGLLSPLLRGQFFVRAAIAPSSGTSPSELCRWPSFEHKSCSRCPSLDHKLFSMILPPSP